jgi:hypothetical protein
MSDSLQTQEPGSDRYQEGKKGMEKWKKLIRREREEREDTGHLICQIMEDGNNA